MTAGEAVAKILGALEAVDGLRPAVPLVWDAPAVDLDPEVVQVRLVATRLPLPPLLDRAAEAVRPVLAGTPWAHARLRLVVTDLDGAAFARPTSQ
ncbi:hypothetical protein SAMN04489727_1237 [Amycolatopsis tolypomycina]|uniref:Asp23 family, cell envelope-related function n=1 Tax=Amycolatopsis tolypomycina TaxID=208445 RepID=A0A1H4IX24_9PSEU|nr:hypothetical protein [Amycolatopsis tolypomycina]SEB38619.1 hypothetical protein SAMN04489727_1237 [Amycolatopsis tolypomycina]